MTERGTEKGEKREGGGERRRLPWMDRETARDKDRERLRKLLLRKPETPPRVLTSDFSCWGF